MAEEDLPPLVALIQANIEQFLAKMDAVEGKIDSLTDQVFDIHVGLAGNEEVKAQVDDLNARLDEFGRKNETAKVSVDTRDASQGVSALLSSILAFGPAAVAAGATAAGALAAIPALLGGIGLAGAAAALSVQGLSGAIKAYGAAATNTGQSAATAAKQMQTLRTEFGALAPAAQQFVIFYETGLKPVLADLSKADQQIIFSGLLKSIQQSVPLMQALVPLILDAAKGMSDWLVQLTAFLSSAQGLSEVNTILGDGLQFMAGLGRATLTVIEAVGRLGSQAGPIVEGIANGANLAANAFDRWTQDGGSEKFLAYVEEVGPQVFDTLGKIGAAIIAVAQALGSVAGPDLQLLQFLAGLIIDLVQVNPQLAGFLLTGLGIVGLLSKLAGPLSATTAAIKGIATALGFIGPAADAAEAESATAFAGMLGPIGLVIAAVGGLVGAFALADNALSAFFKSSQEQLNGLNEDASIVTSNASTAAEKLKAAQQLYIGDASSGAGNPNQLATGGTGKGPLGALGPLGPNAPISGATDASSAAIAKIQKEIADMAKNITGSANKSFNDLYANSVAATNAAKTAQQTLAANLLTNVTGAHQKGLSDLNGLLAATHSGSLTQLNAALIPQNLGALNNMVTKLDATHKAELAKLTDKSTAQQKEAIEKQISNNEALSKKILTAITDAEAKQVQEAVAIQAAEAAAETAATVNATNIITNDMANAAKNVSAAALQLANDSAKLLQDKGAGDVSGINDASTVATDLSNQQVQAIQDQSAILLDTKAEALLIGTALKAQQAQVSLDIQKQTDDAKVNADRLLLDQQKQTDDGLIAAATAHADQVSIDQDNKVSAAQAAYDSAVQADDGKVNTATIVNAIAQAGENTDQQASAASALLYAQQNQSTDLANLGSALDAARSEQAAKAGEAQASLQAIQSSAQLIEAIMAATLAGDIGAASVAEAKLSAILAQLNAQAAAEAAAANAATTAANPTTTPINLQATIVTQIDGQQVAIMTTPLIREQLLRTTARHTQNIYGGSAGRLIPS